MEEVWIEVTVALDLGLCLQGHTKWVGDFSMLVGVYKDGNTSTVHMRSGFRGSQQMQREQMAPRRSIQDSK
jgi:hypothetical protein